MIGGAATWVTGNKKAAWAGGGLRIRLSFNGFVDAEASMKG